MNDPTTTPTQDEDAAPLPLNEVNDRDAPRHELEDAYVSSAVWYAAWCLRGHFGPRVNASASPLVTARTFVEYLGTLGADYSTTGFFATLHGYDPRTLTGTDAFLFRVHMQVYKEQAAARLGGSTYVADEAVEAEFRAAFARQDTLSPNFLAAVSLQSALFKGARPVRWVSPWDAEWDDLLGRMFPLTYAGYGWMDAAAQRETLASSSTPPHQDNDDRPDTQEHIWP